MLLRFGKFALPLPGEPIPVLLVKGSESRPVITGNKENQKRNRQEIVAIDGPGHHGQKIASDREADMIVLGARASTEVGTTHLPWSTTHQVIAQAHCPVLTIRG